MTLPSQKLAFSREPFRMHSRNQRTGPLVRQGTTCHRSWHVAPRISSKTYSNLYNLLYRFVYCSNLPILYLPYLNISFILESWNIKTTTSPGLAGRLAILNSSMLLSPDLRIKRAILKPNPWDWKWSRFNFHAPGQDLGGKIVGSHSKYPAWSAPP